jgi:hypothetical protein
VGSKNRHSPKTRSGIDRVTKPSTEAAVAEDVPSSDSITPYDEADLTVYLRLLDAAAAGATVDDMARIILGIDPSRSRNERREPSPAICVAHAG